MVRWIYQTIGFVLIFGTLDREIGMGFGQSILISFGCACLVQAAIEGRKSD